MSVFLFLFLLTGVAYKLSAGNISIFDTEQHCACNFVYMSTLKVLSKIIEVEFGEGTASKSFAKPPFYCIDNGHDA